jgi:hypothetical protein
MNIPASWPLLLMRVNSVPGSAGYVNLGKSATRKDKPMRYTACVKEAAGNVP